MPIRSSRSAQLFAYLGRISYGLYIFHWFFIEAFGVPAAHDPPGRAMPTAALLALSVRSRWRGS